MKSTIKKKEEAILTQILLNNTNQIKICAYLENLDKKINNLLEKNIRSLAAAIPLPKLPASFVSTHDALNAVEALLTVESCVRNKEELVSQKFNKFSKLMKVLIR